MSHEETDPYELKLFQMFQSCDTYQNGLLDKEALNRLCGLLELSDKGAVIMSNLSTTGAIKVGITFEQFKEALLQFLGAEMDNNKFDISPSLIPEDEHVLIIGERIGDNESLKHNLVSLSESEDFSKPIYGTKKYGRNLRIQQLESSLSDSEPIEDVYHNEHRNCSPARCNSKQHQRCSSQTDIPNTDSRPARGLGPNHGSKLKRCSSLPAQSGLHTKSIAGKTKKATAQQKTNSSSSESLETLNQIETLPATNIIEIWERANIVNGRGILMTLGIDDEDVNLPQLYKVFEDELRILEDESQSNMMRAMVALQLAELSMLRDTARQLRDENSKLRTDYKNANERAALFAAEIDERHASLEEVSKNKLQLLEQRHANHIRDLTASMANDREIWSQRTANLETILKSMEQENLQLKTDLELLRKENNEFDSENQRLQKQNIELLENNIELNSKLASSDDFNNLEQNVRSAEESNELEMQRLMERIAKKDNENAELRDKNDELIVELENLNLEFLAAKTKLKKYTTTNVPTTNAEKEVSDETDNNEIGKLVMQVKNKALSDQNNANDDTLAHMATLRKSTNDNNGNELNESKSEWIALNTELDNVSKNKHNSETKELKEKVTKLEAQIKLAQTSVEKTITVAERCKELEASLEQMQRAYEDCEDYWQNKLSDERQLFEEEQQENEKKFTDLMEKVREYEDQFKNDGRLSPIPEKDILEGQYAELEAETEEVRKMLDDKVKEIEDLQNENADLRLRLGESVEILTGAAEYTKQDIEDKRANSHSAAASPISYLWHQSTIQNPATQYHDHHHQDNLKMQNDELQFSALLSCPTSPNKQTKRNILSTSETSIFSTTLVENAASTPSSSALTESPIQKANVEGDVADCETSSTTSGKSYETHSIASTHSIHRNIPTPTSSRRTSPNNLKEELKRLKYFETTLKEQIKDLSLERDGLIMELQQLQEAKPVLEKAYARTAHPSLIQRVNQLELKNRHMQNVIKQQQQYIETLLQQSWQQHQLELGELHNRIEQQGVLLAEQSQRLQNADILVKDLYVENSNLTANVQRLEQQRARINYMHQQQQLHGINGLPGMP